MARGGISFEGIGAKQATFVAGSGLKTLVADNDRDIVVGMPVVISGDGEVDLGVDTDTPFGFVDVYEDDDHVGVQFCGFRADVPIVSVAPAVGDIVATDGAGKAKKSATTAKLRSPVFVEVDSASNTATVFLG